MSRKNIIFIYAGNCRTFIDCFDSSYDNIISKLFSNDYNIYIYLYLKLSDPGPKGQFNWDFSYTTIKYNTIINKIDEIKKTHPLLKVEYKLLEGNEISDNDLLSQVKDRQKYNSYYERDNVLLRGLHCHYNFERCGEYILKKEKSIQSKFSVIVYIRPDLYFTAPSNSIHEYSNSIVTFATGPVSTNFDHLAIIPREHLDSFFFDRMKVYRNNTVCEFGCPEDVYSRTLEYEIKPIGMYTIQRETSSP